MAHEQLGGHGTSTSCSAHGQLHERPVGVVRERLMSTPLVLMDAVGMRRGSVLERPMSSP